MTDLSEVRGNTKEAKAIDRFFERELLPLSRDLAARGVKLLDAGRDPSAASYYRARRLRTMAPADFEWGGAESAEQLEGALRRLWRAHDDAALAALVPSLVRLAVELRRKPVDSGDVSEFVYVMY